MLDAQTLQCPPDLCRPRAIIAELKRAYDGGAVRSTIARDMNTVPDFIRNQKIGSLAVFVRSEKPSAITMHFPLNALSRFKRMTAHKKCINCSALPNVYANK